MKLIRTNIWLRQDHQKKLKAISNKTGQAVSELIRRAVEEFLKKKQKQSGTRSVITPNAPLTHKAEVTRYASCTKT